MHNVFGNYSSHNYIQNTLECTQLNYLLKIFLEEHTLESSINKIEQRYTHSTINNARGMYYNTTPLAKKLHPLFGHRFLPLKNDHSFRSECHLLMSKGKHKAPQKEKRGTSHGEKKPP